MSKPFSPALLRSAIHKALDKIGNVGETALSEAGSNIDPILHQGYVFAELKSATEKRYKDWLAVITTDTDLALADKIAKVQAGQSATLLSGTRYSFNLKVNNPPEKFDKTKFVNELRKAGVKPETIDKALSVATSEGTAAKRFEVSFNIGDEL
jgi:hypothetical protein